MTILKIQSGNLREVIKQAVTAIKNGKSIISPTDTVYGLLADATDKNAIKRIFQIKKRPKGKPIPIFVKDIKMAKRLAFINKAQEEFLKTIWPGKVTIVLKRKNILPDIISGGKKTIGLRIPDYELVNALLKKLDRPLTGTSANVSGKPVSAKIKEVVKQFKKEKIGPDLVLDAGNLRLSLPSRVLDLTGKKIKILRR